VVVSEAGDVRSSHQIQAAITDMRIVELVPSKGDGRGGRPHTVQFWMSGGVFQDALVCSLKANGQQGLGVTVGSFGKHFLDRFDRDAAGFLATFVAAHAIGHNRQSALAREFLVARWFPVCVVVLVIFSLAANVAEARQLYSGPYSHHTLHAAFESDLG
jgi:hypothetical protein